MRKLDTTVLAGLLVALLGFGLVFAYGQRVEDRVAEGQATVPVLVAMSAVGPGMTIAELGPLLETREVPRLYVADGALTSLDDVRGQVLLGGLTPGSQVTAAAFGQPSGVAAVEPEPGRVALAVSVGISPGVARYLVPGSVVDVFVTYEGVATTDPADPDAAATDAGLTKLFVSGVEVMSVTIAAPPAATGEETAEASAPTGDQVVAVLDLTPEDAEKVVNATTLGSLYLALVGASGETHTTPGASPADVVGSNR